MRLAEIRDLLHCQVLCGEQLLDLEVTECFAADLMSDVLAYCKPRVLLITGLTGVQSIHTADVADLGAILFVRGKQPIPQVLELARANGIPVLSTPYHLFDACGLLYARGLRAGAKP